MHIHILGIGKPLMSGLALLARQAGYYVTGCEAGINPSLLQILKQQKIQVVEDYHPRQLSLFALSADAFVVSHTIARGNPLLEATLNNPEIKYSSGAQWLAENILKNKQVVAVAGRQGKTITGALLAWILEFCEYKPSFLVHDIPINFGTWARLTDDTPHFVIEADEHVSAFFDRRAQFLHYHAQLAVLTNFECPRDNLAKNSKAMNAAIETQLQHWIHTLSEQTQLIINRHDTVMQRVLKRGHWSQVTYFDGKDEEASVDSLRTYIRQLPRFPLNKDQVSDALAAVTAAVQLGIPTKKAIAALRKFKNVRSIHE